MKNLSSVLTAALLVLFTGSVALAQAAPAEVPQAPVAAPAVAAAPADPFPPSNPKFFTAKTPTLETATSFAHQTWGYDPNRVMRVMAIRPTAAAGVSEVIVFMTDKAPDSKVQVATLYVMPDGNHAIILGSGVIPFGATPYAAKHDLLKARANGAARGAVSKDLLLVEFADLQCPFCKDAQGVMDQIAKDFPAARIVFQEFPLVDKHPSAFKAAAYGVCAQKESDDAFFKYAAGVFDTQSGLTPATEDTILKAAAMRAGLVGETIAACAETQATKDVVNASIKLAGDVGIDQTPSLAINGRVIPLNIPYDVIKQLIVFQAKLDGVPTGAAADILVPKPAPPTLSTLPK